MKKRKTQLKKVTFLFTILLILCGFFATACSSPTGPDKPDNSTQDDSTPDDTGAKVLLKSGGAINYYLRYTFYTYLETETRSFIHSETAPEEGITTVILSTK